MTIVGRRSITTHPIGPDGLLVVRTVRGSVRIRGIDGNDVHLEAHYSLRAATPEDEARVADPEADGVLRITRLENELRVEVTESTGGIVAAIGRMMSGGQGEVDLDIGMPRTARLQLSGVSADVEVRDLQGDQSYRTISGDAALTDVSGTLRLQSVSGDMSVRGGDLRIEGNTTSGDLSVAARRLELALVKSVSADIRLSGSFAPGVGHSVETVSGDLEVAPAGGLTIRMSGISGSIHSDVPHRVESSGGRRVLTVGDGAAALEMRTMSGDVNVVAGPLLIERIDVPGTPPAITAAVEAPEAANDEMEILRALERGEIDVDEAARRLEGANYHA